MPDPQMAELPAPAEAPSAVPAAAIDCVIAPERAAGLESSAVAETQFKKAAQPVESVPAAPASWLWLTKQDQTFVTICVAIFLALTGYHWARLGGWGMQTFDVDRLPARQYDFRIDINSASWVEWTQIEGIGQVTANKIIADRDSNGPFRSINDLLRVKGIGPKTLEKMRPFLREPNDQDAKVKAKS